MAEKLVLLLAGFVLTSVLGGGMGYLFQRRSWAHQHEVERVEQQRQLAIKVFEEVSSLLDKRLYRMRLLYWAAKRAVQGSRAPGIPAALEDYRETLEVWNDNLNRNLALVHSYFGYSARRRLESELYEEYASIGRALEDFVRIASAPAENVDIPPLGRRLSALGHKVYLFNLSMLELLQSGQLGVSAPTDSTTGGAHADQLPVLHHGDTGPAVRRLQEGLRRCGSLQERIDGHFGRQTEQAVRAFQAERGLDVDGIVGHRTWVALSQGPLPSHTGGRGGAEAPQAMSG